MVILVTEEGQRVDVYKYTNWLDLVGVVEGVTSNLTRLKWLVLVLGYTHKHCKNTQSFARAEKDECEQAIPQ